MKKLKKFDWLIIGVLVLVILVIGYKQVSDRYLKFSDDKTSIELSDLTFTYRVDEIRMMSVAAIEVGQTLYELDSMTPLGTIASVTYEPAKDWILTKEGQYVYAEIPEKYTTYIQVEGQVLETESKILAQGIYELKINSEVKIGTRIVGFTARLDRFE